MNFNPQPLPLIRRTKVPSDQIKPRISRGKLMFRTLIAKMQPGTTGVIVHFNVVDTMGNPSGVRQPAQPVSVLRRIGRKIQDHRHASPQ